MTRQPPILTTPPVKVAVPFEEIVGLCATDGDLFVRTFFPKVFRQPSAEFHRILWDDWRDTSIELSAISVFRGGGKTTWLRAFVALCIAYGISRTVLFIGASQPKAVSSADWIRRLVEGSGQDGDLFRRTFGLRPGPTWNTEQLTIINDSLHTEINLLPRGITGDIRGINLESYRPDLIILDDVQTEENVGTPEQLAKTNELVYASIRNTLAMKSDAPNRKMVMLQTPIRPKDLISQAEVDPEWKYRRFGARGADGKSVWPAGKTTEELDKLEAGYRARYQWAFFAREFLCVNVPDEGQYFNEQDLRYYETPPEKMVTAYGIDPVPPPTPGQVAKGNLSRDFEGHLCVGMTPDKDIYVLDYDLSRNHQPDWSANKMFELAGKWRPLRIRVNATAYEVTLKWVLDQEMRKRGIYYVVETWQNRRAKPIFIRQTLSGLLAHHKLYVRKEMHELQKQIALYPGTEHDDLLDVLATACSLVLELSAAGDMDQFFAPHSMKPLGEGWRHCP